jgi:AcrR family transcriptional regulator
MVSRKEPAMTTELVPRALRALWGEDPAVRRGPKPTLSVVAIAEAAIAVADAEGLGAVSMAAVAKRLGFTTMSLYRYVDSKDDLQLVMVDVALGPPPALDGRRGWRRRITAWAHEEYARLVAHPWVLDVPFDTPPVGPNALAWMDCGLRILGRSGLESQQAASALLLVDGYVRSQTALAHQYGDPDGTRLWAEQVRALVDPETLPSLAAALAAGVFDDSSAGRDRFPGEEFEFGLGLVLDGIAVLAERPREG